MKKIIKLLFSKLGYTVGRIYQTSPNPNLSSFANQVIEKVRPYTMSGKERIAALVDAIEYIEKNKIEGDFVECGVWKGGSVLAMIECLKKNHSYDRTLYLYDTFEGMSSPTSDDKDYRGQDALELLKNNVKTTENAMWAYAPLDLVKSVVYDKGYPNEKIKLIKGRVEETIPDAMPGRIALLRLDTDFYESTKHEMQYLFPLLVSGGILIIDDYGCWLGSKKAVDEYIETSNVKIFLSTIDWTGKIGVKQ